MTVNLAQRTSELLSLALLFECPMSLHTCYAVETWGEAVHETSDSGLVGEVLAIPALKTTNPSPENILARSFQRHSDGGSG